MGKMLYTVTWDEGQPTIKQICEKYGFKPEEIDQKFGVIEIDPAEHLYSILVDEAAVGRLQGRPDLEAAGLEGPFADVRIEPFGPTDEW
jgi:hypothetical protein